MNLVGFVKSLPADWVLAPIYRKGALMHSGRLATGKNPVEVSFDKDLGPHDAALRLEKNPKLDACGLFTGLKGRGLVIVDVDANLTVLKRKWGESLNGAPVITSTRKNAAKFIFRVPEELWHEVSGFPHSDQHAEGFEVLWGRQGLIAGVYPGSKCGKYPAGEYSFEGDPNSVPEAPEWLLSEMRAAKAPSTWIKNRSALDLSDRTEDEITCIIEDCLNVVDGRGANSRDFWVRIGMAIHSVLPNDRGLQLWSEWSQKDCDYADEWERGNPCEEPWSSFKPGKVGLGSLIWIADQVDPERRRFSETTRKNLETAEARVVQEYRTSTLSYDEVIKRGMQCYEMDDIPRMNYELHKLALEAGYRDQGDLEQLITDYISSKDCGTRRTMDQRTPESRRYVIPALLPRPYTLLVHGREGSGKSASVLCLMKHVVDGIPFQLRGQQVQVEQGPVIYFNSDMSAQDFEEEFDLHEIKNQHLFHEVPDFNLYRKVQFMKIMKEVKPAMICIDSLSSCSGSKSENENKASFAGPLYWINARNGKDWPPCTVAILHHTSKSTGEARGSTAIAAAAAEVWRVETPTEENKLKPDQRLITVGKSRIGRVGERLLQIQQEDLTVQMVEWQKPDAIQTKAGSLAEKILQRLLVSNQPMSRIELNSDSLVGGSVDAIRKTLQRMANRGVIKVVGTRPREDGKGSPENLYVPAGKKNLGGTQNTVQQEQIPSAGTEDKCDTSQLEKEVSQKPGAPQSLTGTPSKNEDECPSKKSSDTNGSAPTAPLTEYPRGSGKSGMRSEEELRALLDQSQWD